MAEKNTQAEFARLVGITQPAVSQLIKKGVLSRNGTLVKWIGEYCQNLREQAAGRQSGNSQWDLMRERARLDSARADKAEIEAARLRADLLPLIVVADIIAFHNSTLRARNLGIPNAVKAKHPECPTAIFLSLKEIVTEVLTELSHVRFPADLDERIKQYFRDLHSPAKPDGDGVGE